MGLRDRQWPRFLNAPDPRLLAELYEPALREAVRYDRCCAYFSSSVLAAASRGFGPLVERLLNGDGTPASPPIRFLVNEELSKDDVDAMLFAQGADALAERLSKRLLAPADAIERERLALLGLLVKQGLLEVRVGVMRSGRGILHAKFGLIYDGTGDAIVFNGSGNESASGLVANYEKLEVTGSWTDQERREHFEQEFDQLWRGDSAQVDVISLPEAVRERLIRYSENESAPVPAAPSTQSRRARLEAWMRWRFALDSPWFPDGGRNCDAMAPGTSLWPHQVSVVEECSSAWPAGRLLCDEVGMGKTIEAIMILRRLLAGRGVRRALLLVPAGIVQQWQGELREKGGLLVPRLEGQSTLVWPDGRVEYRDNLATALREPLLLMSREMARLEQNAAVLMGAPRWDLVLLDEAHAARRASQEESEFNSATLLLALLRRLQLEGRARGLLLLSATPMQTHPWEPWDLLGVLGEGAPWLADFGVVREFYGALEAAESGPVQRNRGVALAQIATTDAAFGPLPSSPEQIPTRLLVAPASERRILVSALRDGAPLGRRMHRNTRQTLRAYHRLGLIERPPADRIIQDVRYDFNTPDEREVYDGVQSYVESRFRQLEEERPGKGFVMTVYRRRAASSPVALRRSLERRRAGLELVARGAAADQLDDIEASDQQDLDDLVGNGVAARLPSSLPEDPVTARSELREVDRLLGRLLALGGRDSKLERFAEALALATNDGRACLVFSEFTDSVEYLRDELAPRYGDTIACYTGSGGSIRVGGVWKHVSKEEITDRLARLEIRVLLCSDAASEGLNLQTASALINYDLPWNPARVEQRIGRIDRIGQKSHDLRVVNLVLANSVDERVYQVLSQRCDLFRTFVGAMQPVLSVARRMLLGVQEFDAAVLNAVADSAQSDRLATAAFQSNDAPPPAPRAPGVTMEDLARAYQAMGHPMRIETGHGERALAVSGRELEEDEEALPFSPFLAEVRTVGDSAPAQGELLPLVLEAHTEGPFRVSVAAWVSADGPEIVDRSARLEALLAMWDGAPVSEAVWNEARKLASNRARELVVAMRDHATREERLALERQVGAAKQRLQRELARFLACARETGEDFNRAFHRWMQRGGETAALLTRAHGLVGYPEWTESERREAEQRVERLTANQRKNLLLGTPLQAAIRDPRWQAMAVLVNPSPPG